MEQRNVREHVLPIIKRVAKLRRRSMAGFCSPRRLSFESLEGRDLLAVFTVTNLNDAVVNTPGAAGTLRQAIFDANATPGVADEIVFGPALGGTIQLTNVGSQVEGSSAFVVTSPITIRGNANGITLQRGSAAPEMRLFRVSPTGNLTLESIMLVDGVARGEQGDMPGEAGSQGRGGAILNQGTLEVVGSTLYGNAAIGGNGLNAPGGPGIGGAIANDGGTVTIKNSTLSGNSVASGLGTTSAASFGGGVYSLNGLLRIYNSTISNNSASSGRQVYVFAVAGTSTVELFSSIVTQQGAQVISDFVALADTDAEGELFVTGSNNIVRFQIGLGGTDFINDDPLLAPLADNGGPTLTHALPAASPAVDSGSNLFSLSNDQRGSTFARAVGAAADVGSFELQSAPALPGDYNRDDTVDAADYVVWRKTMGSGVATYDGADGNGSGAVDVGDYPVWTENFGEDLPAGSGGSSCLDSLESATVATEAKDDLLLSYDFAAYKSDNDEATQTEAPPLPLELRPIIDDTHDKALLAVLLGWDAARGERTSIPFV